MCGEGDLVVGWAAEGLLAAGLWKPVVSLCIERVGMAPKTGDLRGQTSACELSSSWQLFEGVRFVYELRFGFGRWAGR